jgi:hypothetical protein
MLQSIAPFLMEDILDIFPPHIVPVSFREEWGGAGLGLITKPLKYPLLLLAHWCCQALFVVK